ncbi:Sucrose-6-phosphate hydrolase (plasmid) [Escherichia coli]|nr:Sucrose-6-phosphate hydrolase [Escherichia coli]
MWECPDFFRCGNFHWLMFSPQGMTPSGYRFRNLFQSGVLAGSWKPGSVFALKGDLKSWIMVMTFMLHSPCWLRTAGVSLWHG